MFLFPTVVIEENAKFQFEIPEYKNIIFAPQGPPEFYLRILWGLWFCCVVVIRSPSSFCCYNFKKGEEDRLLFADFHIHRDRAGLFSLLTHSCWLVHNPLISSRYMTPSHFCDSRNCSAYSSLTIMPSSPMKEFEQSPQSPPI